MTVFLTKDSVYQGDCLQLLRQVEPESVALSVWSPPYHVGKAYEQGQSYDDWASLIRRSIGAHKDILKPGGFCAINIADILAFPDESMPRIQALNPGRQGHAITREDVVAAQSNNPGASR